MLETRRLPGSGAGPSPDRLLLGSEGTLGIITEAWMRLQDRPTFRANAVGRFPTWADGVSVCATASGLFPANCRLLDATEAMITGAGDGSADLLLVAFESADHPVDAWIARAVELMRDHGGTVDAVRVHAVDQDHDASGDDEAGAWAMRVLRAPYRCGYVVAAMGMVNETFETAVTWNGFDQLYGAVMAAVREALREIGAPTGVVTCRLTHVYPDGAAPYFTVIAPGQACSWNSGRRSSPRRRKRCSTTVAQSPITTRSAATIDRGTTFSVPTCLPTCCAVKHALDPAADPQSRCALRFEPRKQPVNFGIVTYCAVIFDLGGVIFPSPFDVFTAYEREHKLPDHFLRGVVAKSADSGAWARLERGESDFSEFCAGFEAECAAVGGTVDAATLMTAVGAWVEPRRKTLVAVLFIRGKGLKTAALTNNWAEISDDGSGHELPAFITCST